jgi:hypothetical protein
MMNRRNFLTAAVVAGAGITTGLGATAGPAQRQQATDRRVSAGQWVEQNQVASDASYDQYVQAVLKSLARGLGQRYERLSDEYKLLQEQRIQELQIVFS